MKRLTLAECIEGMAVVLTHPDDSYVLDKSNPLDCEGKVSGIEGDYIHVRWDNGHVNSYKELELSSIDPQPKYNSIWDTMLII